MGACQIVVPAPDFSTATAEVSLTSPPPTDIQAPPPSPTEIPLNPTITQIPTTTTSSETLAPITDTPLPNLTSTLATSTDPATSPTPLPPTTIPGQASLTPTLGILTYGTLPPAVPSNAITVWNRSGAQAYISLQVTRRDGEISIIEYPVRGKISLDIPVGNCVYVAWVGGNKMVGSFVNHANDSLTVILFKQKVVIK